MLSPQPVDLRAELERSFRETWLTAKRFWARRALLGSQIGYRGRHRLREARLRELGLVRIVAGMNVLNPASIRVADKLGLVRP